MQRHPDRAGDGETKRNQPLALIYLARLSRAGIPPYPALRQPLPIWFYCSLDSDHDRLAAGVGALMDVNAPAGVSRSHFCDGFFAFL